MMLRQILLRAVLRDALLPKLLSGELRVPATIRQQPGMPSSKTVQFEKKK
jgi:hypothetical protein